MLPAVLTLNCAGFHFFRIPLTRRMERHSRDINIKVSAELNHFISQSRPQVTLKARIGKQHIRTGEARPNVCMGL